MGRRIGWWVSVLLLAPLTLAWGRQAPAGEPRLDVGFGVSANTTNESTGSITPSVRVNFGPSNGLQIVVDRDTGPRAAHFTDVAAIDFRRVIHRFNRGDVRATVGGAYVDEYLHYVSPYVPRSGGRYEYTRQRRYVVATSGVGVSWEISQHLKVGGDLGLGLSNAHFFVRLATGLVVPIGPVQRSARPLKRSARPNDPLAGIYRGQRLWVRTASGDEVAGEAVSLSDDEVVVASGQRVRRLTFADIQRIETTDHVRNGVFGGLGVGAIAGGVVGVLVCHCEEYTALAAMSGAALGGSMGVVIGVIGDSLVEGRRVVYVGRTARQVAVAPIVARHSGGLGGVVSW